MRKMKHIVRFLSVLLSVVPHAASSAETRLVDPGLVLMKWDVDGASREAGVYIPKTVPTNGCPVVFVFHGRGGTVNSTIKYFAFHDQWPEAVVVYMQGLPMSAKAKGDTGWQLNYGEHGDRDLKFLDAVLATLHEKSAIDDGRIYVTGHSLGGSFIYLLWQTRGDIFAAVAPVATGMQYALTCAMPPDLMKPKPMLHIAGRRDSIIKFKIQEATVNMVKKMNECDVKPVKWGNNYCAKYPSGAEVPVVAYFHPSGHEMPKDAVTLIIKFFKEHQKP